MHKAGVMEFIAIGATPAMPESVMAVRAAGIDFISPAKIASEKTVEGDNGVTALPQKRTTCGIQLMSGAMLMSVEPYEEILARWRAALQEEFDVRKSIGMA